VGKITWPAQRGGGLYVREGGIIAFGPLMQFRGEKPLHEVNLYLFPGPNKSVFEFYEDDGVSFDHLRGKFALTSVSARAAGGWVEISVGKASGGYSCAAGRRRWSFTIALDFEPRRVTANGRQLPERIWKFDAKRREISIGAQHGPINLIIAGNSVDT
jgi:alpha-D-xyloside xylohydrolase